MRLKEEKVVILAEILLLLIALATIFSESLSGKVEERKHEMWLRMIDVNILATRSADVRNQAFANAIYWMSNFPVSLEMNDERMKNLSPEIISIDKDFMGKKISSREFELIPENTAACNFKS